jgi:hypothetical protein
MSRRAGTRKAIVATASMPPDITVICRPVLGPSTT